MRLGMKKRFTEEQIALACSVKLTVIDKAPMRPLPVRTIVGSLDADTVCLQSIAAGASKPADNGKNSVAEAMLDWHERGVKLYLWLSMASRTRMPISNRSTDATG